MVASACSTAEAASAWNAVEATSAWGTEIASTQDTAGQEKFHALGPIYYRDADAALLVYDITDSDSFLRVTKWVKELKQMASKDIVMAIAANKSDLVRLKNIDTQDAVSYAESIVTNLFVTSAKAGTGIDDVFSDIAKRRITREEKKQR
ncbi:unnamed protein product [Miscanthus lutarioriparius]|uniref:Uncharacterized protein n=1 Tax=Miscanthus lutarioriparius TaxID=422564 RepID=A0A811RW53_9POAL|nr:unnamed protein product [Miscanthus lutarioriparius]